MKTRVAVIYNGPGKATPKEHSASEHSVVDEANLIAEALRQAGYAVSLFGAADCSTLVDFLQSEKPDVIFNCCESLHGVAHFEMNVASVYELCGIPYTGTPALSLGLALHKGMAKALLCGHSIPTPRYSVVDSDRSLERVSSLTLPVIVKPIAEDASIGIHQDSVVHDMLSLSQQVRRVREQFRQPALVEEFVDGREVSVALLARSPGEFTVLPISEIVFGRLPGGAPNILTYEAKWMTESDWDRATVPRCPADLESSLADEVGAIALEAARAIGVRDYGRVDFRLRAADNAIFVLEVNPNPDISADSGFIRAAKASGRTVNGTICEILESALERHALCQGRPAI